MSDIRFICVNHVLLSFVEAMEKLRKRMREISSKILTVKIIPFVALLDKITLIIGIYLWQLLWIAIDEKKDVCSGHEVLWITGILWNVVSVVFILLIQFLINMRLPNWIEYTFAFGSFFGLIARIFYNCAFCIYFGRHTIVLCNDSWKNGQREPLNYFAVLFSIASIISFIEIFFLIWICGNEEVEMMQNHRQKLSLQEVI
jgi:hypothetical protein